MEKLQNEIKTELVKMSEQAPKPEAMLDDWSRFGKARYITVDGRTVVMVG